MKIFAIARNTFTESIRQPIFVVMLGVGLILLTLNPALSGWTLDDDNKLLTDLGLSTIFICGLVLAAFTATGVLAREIENKTVLTVISKPVSRLGFIVGKYLGVMAALCVAAWIWSLVFLLTVRHRVMEAEAHTADWPVIVFGFAAVIVAVFLAVWGNYFYNWVFTSRFTGILAVTMGLAYLAVLLVSKKWEFQPLTTEFTKEEGFVGQLILGLLLLMEALAIICAIAVACSTRLGQVMTLVICLAVFMLGLTSDYFFGRHTQATPIAWGAYGMLPNLQFLWMADALTQKSTVTGAYVGLVSGYSLLYIVAVLAVATALFQTRETG